MIKLQVNQHSGLRVGQQVTIDGDTLKIEGFYRQRGDVRYALCLKNNGRKKYIQTRKLVAR